MTAQPSFKAPARATHGERVFDKDAIVIHGAREHNLRNLDLALPKRRLIVFTGPSGSGKSSLAFDTVYAEGRRRYVESLSTYARQFLGQIDKPDFDYIAGLSPTISIEQKTSTNNPRSTVGTVTELHDHLRVLYARLGQQFCHECDRPITSMSKEAIIGSVLSLDEGTKFMVLAPLVRNRKGEYRDLFEELRQDGFIRARIDGEIVALEDVEKVALHTRHDIDVVVDRLIAKPGKQQRITDSVELALSTAGGRCIIVTPPQGDEKQERERLYSTERACTHCNIAFPELSHQSFSFNSPLGMCSDCQGIGTTDQVAPDSLVIDGSKSLAEGAVEAIGPHPESDRGKRFKHAESVKKVWKQLETSAKARKIDLDRPWSELTSDERELVLFGPAEKKKKSYKGFEGVVDFVAHAHKKARKKSTREFFGEFQEPAPCPTCDGTRMRPESRAVRFKGRSLAEVGDMGIDEARAFFEEVELEGRDAVIGTELIEEIRERLGFLLDVGLDYLSLGRAAQTLSGGEAQRIRLASQLGSELSGILYVLDEPSIGLHARDHRRLLETLESLRDQGNSVIVVEHDRDTMEHADLIVDFGPGAGRVGGDIVAMGTPDEILESSESLTADYLAGRKKIAVPEERRSTDTPSLWIRGARHNNLKGIDARFPTGTFTCVTGVSGAGKSSLVNETLYPAIARNVYFKHRSVGAHDEIEGLELFDKVIKIDQSPIGRTPRSNPATYTKVFDHIRDLFANLPESRMYGFDKGRFSFNVKEGRCDECKGQGVQTVEMSFLADVYVPCDACLGRRFDPTTLRVKYRGHSINDVLDMTIAEAAEVFDKHPKISRIMQTLLDVGLDYIQLGQPSPTLSGGEAQRVKLSRELAKIATGDTLYILDEPSTGLHFHDISKLLGVVDQLVDAGNTVVMIEHNIDIIKCADYLIDIGPEGGHEGGHLVAAGTPEEVAEVDESYTGKFLREALG
ncbi:excinuclease ABC subunit UvrA [Persicimonas caeni]|uniref:UvrABC system protein A n=1 Tax=Persicimonas caeni TaxID=2292766 RepID=A0A4Y6PP88_PERCE|nr:excinuclease ABC subunit UvrA [Persicimonas caeni]QDG50124.1 excinuclease ABC subunit UvrA [Persicimonas caeni]QED31345.1 excinuclease ABC subunit UvrA [Persicimonas caeni]